MCWILKWFYDKKIKNTISSFVTSVLKKEENIKTQALRRNAGTNYILSQSSPKDRWESRLDF